VTDIPSLGEIDDFPDEKNGSRDRKPLVEFSKNNPELDWRNYLKMASSVEEEPRNSDVDFMDEKLTRTANSIKWLVDLYDPLKWIKVPGKIEEDCRKDMDLFLGSLKDGKIWAAQSKDYVLMKLFVWSIEWYC
jgi:hypothetical protein